MRPPRGLALAISLVLFAIGTVPHLLAPRACPDSVFTGVLGNWPDTKQHLAFINHYQEALLLPNVLTNEAQKPFMLNLFFWLGGQIALLFGGRPVLGWHALRLIGLLFFSVAATRAVWRFVAPGRRALALIVSLAPLSLALPLAHVPLLDGASAFDGNTLCYVFEQPQLAMGAALAIFGFLGIEQFWESRGARMPWSLVAPVVALWLIHPFEFWSVGFVFAVATAELWRKKELAPGGLQRAVGSALLMAAPALLFLSLDWMSDGGLRALQKLHGDAWPKPWDLLVNLGLPLAVALPLLFGRLAADGDSRQTRLLGIWLLATWASLYLPGAPWRWHQVNGLQVCAAMLAMRAHFWARWRLGAGAVIAALALSLLLQEGYLIDLRKQATTCSLPAFNTPGVDAALTFLRGQGPDARILSRPQLGLEVAMRTRGRPYFGTWRKTLDWRNKEIRSNQFLDGVMGADEAARQLAPLTHVLCREELDRACDDAVMARLGWRPLFASGGARVYGRTR